MKKYTHLTCEERYQIEVHKAMNKSNVWIAKAIGRSESTIRREIKRNGTIRGYKASQAIDRSKKRSIYSKTQRKKITGEMMEYIIAKLSEYHSPEQISGRLEKELGKKVSHETIYKFIYSKAGKRLNLKQYLRHRGRKYQRRDKRKYAGRGYIPGRIDIDERPMIVEEKSRIGDWEIDTIVGANHDGYILSAVDRKTKLTKLAKVDNCRADTVSKALIAILKPYKKSLKTITADNGKEFSYHQLISKNLHADFFFAKPYHSWQRGLNEHTNGLVRQFLPKKSSFANLSHDFVQAIEDHLNNRPRKILNFYTPNEVFFNSYYLGSSNLNGRLKICYDTRKEPVPMEILYLLIPIALLMSLAALYFFFWCIRSNQFTDPKRAKYSILDNNKTDDIKKES